MTCRLIIIFFLVHLVLYARAQETLSKDSIEKWSYHFQTTVISQAHLAFHAAYSGANSLQNQRESGVLSLTSTLFLGRRLWKDASFYFDPEVAGGKGLSYSLGVAGALNGETFRIGDPAPALFVARAYYQQQIALKNSGREFHAGEANQLAEWLPANRITISAGKFAISDFFDDNKYSHDPRSQFFNWALMSNGAWDYPANTRGYTEGIVVEWIYPGCAVRVSAVVPPRTANGPAMDYHISKAHSETIEVEKKININHRAGTLRLLGSYTASKAPSYSEGLQALKDVDSNVLNVFTGDVEWNTYGGKKSGVGFSADQQLSDNAGVFIRAGWNDGKYATWAFTEIDQSISLGLVLKGNKWRRKEDVFGIAAVVNGISSLHREFLNAGGYGFIIGDGRLDHYGNEDILETYYNARVTSSLWATLDYQFVKNPSYNADRGPVHVYGVRLHVEF